MTDDIPTTDPLEDGLRSALARRAGGGTEADWTDLAGRISTANNRRQQRWMGLAATALVLGAVGGYLGGAAFGTSPARTSALPARSSTPAGGAPALAGPSGVSSGSTATGSAVPGPSGLICPEAGSTSTTTPSATLATHLFSRTTADGVAIRAYREPSFACGPIGVSSGGVAQPDLAPVCGAGMISLELSDPSAVGLGTLGMPSPMTPVQPPTSGGGGPTTVTVPPVGAPEPMPFTTVPATSVPPTSSQPRAEPAGFLDSSSGSFGVLEGDPVWWVGVEVSTEVTSVKATFSDGSSDTMPPIGGVAVLAAHVGAQAGTDVQGTLELLGSGGSVLASVPFGSAVVPLPVPLPGGTGGGSGKVGSGGTGSSSTGSVSTGSASAGSSGVVNGTASGVAPAPGMMVACPTQAAGTP